MSKYLPINKVVESVSITHKFNKPSLLFLNTSDIDSGKIINKKYLPISELKGQAKKTIKKDDILFSEIRPKNRRFAYVDVDDTEDYVVSTKLMVLRKINPEVDNKYFYYFLTSNSMLNILQNRAENRICSFPQITFDLLSDYKIRVPEIKEQQRIAGVLSALDSKIDLNNRVNAKLEAIAKTLYDYWFVQFDFPDKIGKPYKSSGGRMVWNEELKRDVPESWNVKSLADITDVSNDQLNPNDTPIKKFKHYSIPAFDESGTYKIESGDEIKSNKFIVKNTDVLVSKLNPWFSRVVYSADENDTICSTEFVVWRAKNISIKNYLYMIAKDASFRSYCTQSATGTSNSHKRVNPTVMMNYRVVYDNEIAEQFGAILGATIKTYAKNHIENKTLTELRDWLLPMLMNGQVKVN
jgi:type I restriction enzyme S subunit